tara:strand:- start:316 stop:474 length:159 start_codon:yes stop_codon:yes gene_type:complete
MKRVILYHFFVWTKELLEEELEEEEEKLEEEKIINVGTKMKSDDFVSLKKAL